MSWILLILVVNITDPKDIPGKVTLEFANETQCEEAKQSMTYWLKFDTFKVQAQCLKK
jgi:hypothetical protein